MKLRFHRYAHERSFRSPQDFARFADEQQHKYEALREAEARAYEWWGKAAAQHWAHAAASARTANADATAVQQALDVRPVFGFDSRLVRVLRDITRRNQKAAAEAIFPFLKGQHDNHTSNQLHVVTLNAHAEFLTALALETASRTERGQASFDDVLKGYEERLENMLAGDLEELESKRDQFEKLLAAATDRFEELKHVVSEDIEGWRAQWLTTHNSFVEQLATETAVKLWSDRSTAHETRYKGFRAWTVGFGLVGILITLVWIFAGFAFARWAFPGDPTAQLASYTAGSLALFTLLVWGLRVLVRSMMSEDHLSTDASARSALAHTYLALTKEKSATPEDRAIILAALFAPVSDGLVKDDGMPALSPGAIAAGMLTNPGR